MTTSAARVALTLLAAALRGADPQLAASLAPAARELTAGGFVLA